MTFIVVTCCSCALPFGLTEQTEQSLRSTGNTFYCPNGHSQSFRGDTVTALRDRLAKAEQRAANSIARAESLAADLDRAERARQRLKRRLERAVGSAS